MPIEFEGLMDLDSAQGFKLDGEQKTEILAQLADPESDLLVKMVQAGVVPFTAGVMVPKSGSEPLLELGPPMPLDKVLGDDGVLKDIYSVGVLRKGDECRVFENVNRSLMARGVVYSDQSDGAFIGQTTILGSVTLEQHASIVNRTGQILKELAAEMHQ